MRYAMAIDTKKCVGCSDCVVACQTENDVRKTLAAGFQHVLTPVQMHLPDCSSPRISRYNCHENPIFANI